MDERISVVQSVLVERGLESTKLIDNQVQSSPPLMMLHLETIVLAVLGVFLLLAAVLYATLVAMRMRNLHRLRELKTSNAQRS
ncbi:hypothetical protein Tcan_17324 [Toxocara canis]|uniref:Uncharacterized protein n=1 Tax=Toxocara canis TaxID=6265 RepID=A0A0B2UIG6_TOXCA|nr:hypothetical protein Tcan_17324 [Toxocara canis]